MFCWINYCLCNNTKSILSGIYQFWMSYINAVQQISLSWIIHEWPFETNRCLIKLRDEEAETEVISSWLKETNMEETDTGSKSTIQGVQILLPNVNGCFTPLTGYWLDPKGAEEHCTQQLSLFFCHCLWEERILGTLTQRMEHQKPNSENWERSQI